MLATIDTNILRLAVREFGNRLKSLRRFRRTGGRSILLEANVATMERQAGIFSAKSEEFYLKEFESLRKEIEFVEQEQRSVERNALIGVGIAWGWLWSTKKPAPDWAYLIPCLFSGLCCIRAYGIMRVYDVFTSYLVTV